MNNLKIGTRIRIDYTKINTPVPYSFPAHMAVELRSLERQNGFLEIDSVYGGMFGAFYTVKGVPFYKIPPEIIEKVIGSITESKSIYEEVK